MSSSAEDAPPPSPERLPRSLRLRRLRFPRTRPRGGPYGYVDGVGWLADGLLWIDGWLTLAPVQELDVHFEIHGTPIRRRTACFADSKASSPQQVAAHRWVLAVPVGTGFETATRVRRIAVGTPWGDLLWHGGYDRFIAPDVVDRLRDPNLPVRLLARLDPFVEKIVRRQEGDPRNPTLRRNLKALRRRWAVDPESGPPPDPLRQRFHLEEAFACAGGLLYFSGWTSLPDESQTEGEPAEASVLLETGDRLPLLATAVREARSDVALALEQSEEIEPSGFLSVVVLDRPGVPASPRLCLHGPGDDLTWRPLEAKEASARELRERSVRRLGAISSSLSPQGTELLQALALATRRERKIARCEAFGMPSANPAVSVIVPLLGPPDLLEHRFLGFQRSRFDVPYEVFLVVAAAEWGEDPDEPEDLDDLSDRVEGLAELYDVPVTLIQLAAETTWSTAAEVGARGARGDLLVFAHGHTLGFAPAGLAALVEPFAADPSIGITAPAIAHFDGAIRSAGLKIGRLDQLEPGSVRPVLLDENPAPGVTVRLEACGADCLAVRRRLFSDLGGFAGLFIEPDLEAVDLCLRAAAAGYETVRVPATFTRLTGGEDLRRLGHPKPRTVAHQYDLETLRHRHRHRFAESNHEEAERQAAAERAVGEPAPREHERDPRKPERLPEEHVNDERAPAAAEKIPEVEGAIR